VHSSEKQFAINMYFTVNNINTTYYTNNGILNKPKTTPEHGSTNEIKTGK